MNVFDTSIIEYLNKFSQKSHTFDFFMVSIVENDFVKGVVLVSILWFFWFQKSNKITYNRECIIICILSCLVAIVLARILALSLPMRLRPIINPGINFKRPFGMETFGLKDWSSFPSDNAVMFFSLATGVFLISRKIGILTYLYVLVVICFPRVYLGYHFPTDILAGAIIGILITFIISVKKISRPITKKVFEFSSTHTGLFYMVAFLLIYEMSTLFSEIRATGNYIYSIFSIYLNK